ncbi:DsbA family protein [Usitatibacter palustris]|uniref:Thioredoxin domain-containing protein n=1 Tax=Usitatibacter palustris TaxID=2732487 RepID=A0A6M4HAW9_9PROT|nr:DsbA family protein [Usitatibacter palustris]QJR16265.1 hypothetical protein DSM104440_03094 [Usitatibacter palustris]
MRTFKIPHFVAALAVALATPAVLAQSPAPTVPVEQRAAIESVVRDYLLKNPEVVREAMQALQAKEEAEKQKAQKLALATHRARIENDATSPVGGNPKGTVVVVEFFDYGCGHCKRAAGAVDGIIEKDKDVKIVYKELPILGPESFHAARAALASRKQGKYPQFHSALMHSPAIDAASVEAIAIKVGLDVKKLTADMDDPAIMATLEANSKLAQDLDIQGTPAFIVGEQFIPGGLDINTLTFLVSTEKTRKAEAKPAKAASLK